MAVEIRELHIKGSVIGSSSIEKKFQETDSSLLNTQFVDRLRKDIIRDCTETILEKLERKNLR